MRLSLEQPTPVGLNDLFFSSLDQLIRSSYLCISLRLSVKYFIYCFYCPRFPHLGSLFTKLLFHCHSLSLSFSVLTFRLYFCILLFVFFLHLVSLSLSFSVLTFRLYFCIWSLSLLPLSLSRKHVFDRKPEMARGGRSRPTDDVIKACKKFHDRKISF